MFKVAFLHRLLSLALVLWCGVACGTSSHFDVQGVNTGSAAENSSGGTHSGWEVVKVSTADPLGVIRSFKPDPVFRDGRLVGAWNACASVDMTATTGKSMRDAGCHVDPDYLDRLSFSFALSSTVDIWIERSPPRVKSYHGPARPALENFAFDHQTRRGSFTIMYHCQKTSEEGLVSPIEVVLPTEASSSIAVRWGKMCKSGVNRLLDLGYKSPSGDIISFYDANEEDRLVVPHTSTVTSLLMSVKPPAVSQAYGPAVVKTSNASVVGASARGASGNGTLLVGHPTEIAIVYECIGLGSAQVLVHVPVPPWSDLSAAFKKDCGGGVPKMISIGTSPNNANVVDHGVVQGGGFPLRKPQSARKTSDDYRPQNADLPAEQFEVSFFIRHVGSVEDGVVHFSDVLVHPEDVHKLYVIVEGYQSGSDFWKQTSGILHAGASRKLTLHMICLEDGVVTVSIALPLLRYKSIEFSVTKACDAPTVSQHMSLFNVTAIEDLLFLGVILCVGGVCACAWWRRRRGCRDAPNSVKYSRLDTAQSA